MGVAEPLSLSVLGTVSVATAGVGGEAVSSLTSISVLDCDWRTPLPFAARTYEERRGEGTNMSLCSH